ncbi:MAG: MFS transporter [Flavobacteriales bacterium]|jgi:maltose/moltooligosaccharide transporter
MSQKNRLHFWQIWNMSFGFLGVQYAFGLQQANMSPIYRYLGADESQIPWLWLAGPVTGLIIQPIIGSMSDRTWHKRWGRRRPYFMVGALLTSVALVLMPQSTELWMAASLLWLLDAAANITMEPFRALIADKLPDEQRSIGYAMQSFFVGLGQTLANVMPLVLTAIGISTVAVTGSAQEIPDFVRYSFFIGAGAILFSIAVTVLTTSEKKPAHLEASTGKRKIVDFKELVEAFKDMPKAMRELWWVKFFTWFGLPLMWQYLALSLSRHSFHAPTPDSPGFEEGVKWANLGLAVFNVLCFLFSLILPALTKKLQAKKTHALALGIGGIGFISMLFTDDPYMTMWCMALVGIAWASIMSIPYVMLSTSVPENRMGVYMGIFNMFIVIPQIINMITIPFIYNNLLSGDPRHALVLAGICLILAGIASLRVKLEKAV